MIWIQYPTSPSSLLFLEFTRILEPCTKVHDVRMPSSCLFYTGLRTTLFKPIDHSTHFFDAMSNHTTYKAKRLREISFTWKLCLEDLVRLFVVQHVACDVDGLVPILGVVRLPESQRRNVSNVDGRDELEWFGAIDRPPDGYEDAAEKVTANVLEERHCPNDRPRHGSSGSGLDLQMFLDAILTDEVGDVRWVALGPLWSPPVDGRVDKVLDVVFQRGFDQGLALPFFRAVVGEGPDGRKLDGEDAKDRLLRGRDGGEDCLAVIQVALDDGKVWLRSQTLG